MREQNLVENFSQNTNISLKITFQTRKRKAKGAKGEKSSKSSKTNANANPTADANNGKCSEIQYFTCIVLVIWLKHA